MIFEPIIGLEVHAQLKTKTKIFCNCSTQFGAQPNAHTCPVCLGMPGVLPVLNKKVVEYTLKMALATHCHIQLQSRFARKNYFYPDLPKGYQISQYEQPIARNGHIFIEMNGEKHRIGITRIHMEEDAGKLNHDPDRPVSLVDLNRTGVPLIEIVSEPELKSPEAAGAYLRHLRSIVRTIDICDGNLEEGSFRCDANVSIRPTDTEELGTRTELKNLNSFRHVEKALQYEINRQMDVLKDNGEVIQETRLWDEGKKKTYSMRGKEDAHDYRYFPDPDLLPLEIDQPWIDTIQSKLPELPDVKKVRFMNQYDLSADDAEFLSTDRKLSDFFESCIKIHPNAKKVSHWIMGPILGLLNAYNVGIENSPISHENLAHLIKLIDDKTISEKMAKTVFEEMAESGKPPEIILKEKDLVQISDEQELEKIIQKILDRCETEVQNYLNGKTKLIGFFVGQVMKETQGQANPQLVNQILKKMLDLHKINK